MAEHVQEWLKSPEVQEIKKTLPANLVSNGFFRDPLRRVYYDPTKFYSPADGTILYAYHCVKPDDPIVEVKGENFTLQNLLNDYSYNTPSLVVGIFMSFYDVHVNRVPTNGFLVEERDTPFIFTHNISMLSLEYNFFNDLPYSEDNLEYLFCNERKVVTVYSPSIGGRYYIVQIADKDVNVIVNWADGEFLTQGERFGMIRWGSQVDLVIPLVGPLAMKDLTYKILVNQFDHVKAGIDPLVEIVQYEG